MKKTYITPALKLKDMEVENMIATSPIVSFGDEGGRDEDGDQLVRGEWNVFE